MLNVDAHIKRVNEAIDRFALVSAQGRLSLKQAAYDEVRSITELTADWAQLVVENCGWPLPEFPVNAAGAVDGLDRVLAAWEALDYFCRNPEALADVLRGTKDPADVPMGTGMAMIDMSGVDC